MAKLKGELQDAQGNVLYPHSDASVIFTSDGGNVEGKLNEQKTEITNLKQSVVNGKTVIAGAISDKGIPTSATAEFQTMANNIASIKGFPDGWDVEKTGEVFETNLIEGDPVLHIVSSDIENGMEAVINHGLPTIPSGTGSYVDNCAISPNGKFIAYVYGQNSAEVYKHNTTNNTYELFGTISGSGYTFGSGVIFLNTNNHIIIPNYYSSGYAYSFYIDEINNRITNISSTTTSANLSSTNYIEASKLHPYFTVTMGSSNYSYLYYYNVKSNTQIEIRSISSNTSSFTYAKKFVFHPTLPICAYNDINSKYLRVFLLDGLTCVEKFNLYLNIISVGMIFAEDGNSIILFDENITSPYITVADLNVVTGLKLRFQKQVTIPNECLYACSIPNSSCFVFSCTRKSNSDTIVLPYKITDTDIVKLPLPNYCPPVSNGKLSNLFISPLNNNLIVKTYDKSYFTMYWVSKKNIVVKHDEHNYPYYSHQNRVLGIATETKNIGQPIKVNCFPKFNLGGVSTMFTRLNTLEEKVATLEETDKAILRGDNQSVAYNLYPEDFENTTTSEVKPV